MESFFSIMKAKEQPKEAKKEKRVVQINVFKRKTLDLPFP
jgi:hypothetical protein